MNLNLVNNFQTVIIGESTVSLSAIDTIFHTFLDDIKHWWRVLLKGIELEDVVKLPDVQVNEPDNGFYFGSASENNFKDYEKLLTNIIFYHEAFKDKFGTVERSKLVLNEAVCYKFLQEV